MPLAITPGEPAGIGPDLIVQLAQQRRNDALIVVGSIDMLRQRADRLGLPLTISQRRRICLTIRKLMWRLLGGQMLGNQVY